MRGTGGAEAISTLYIGSSFEAEGTPGQTATKQTKHIFMGSTRICSIETTDFDQPAPTEHTFYYHGDHLGSSNVITDETGIVVTILEYTPYGELSRNTGNYATDKRFTGKTWDESSNLFYYGARYYDPELGRFITPDPTIQHPFDPQDFSRYQYARSNPVKYIDPTGYSWWSSFWSWVAGFFGAVAAVVVTAITANPILGGAVGGAVSGAILGAVTGGLEGALKGAAIGFAVGGILGAGFSGLEHVYKGAGYAFLGAAMAGGAAYAGVTGGLEGLGDYAAGMAGGMSGFYAGSALIHGTTNLTTAGTPRNSEISAVLYGGEAPDESYSLNVDQSRFQSSPAANDTGRLELYYRKVKFFGIDIEKAHPTYKATWASNEFGELSVLKGKIKILAGPLENMTQGTQNYMATNPLPDKIIYVSKTKFYAAVKNYTKVYDKMDYSIFSRNCRHYINDVVRDSTIK